MKNFRIIIFILFLFLASNVLALTTGDNPDNSGVQPPPANIGKGFIKNIGSETSSESFSSSSSESSGQDVFGDDLLFSEDSENNRILIYETNSDGTLPDNNPDYVLGQPDFLNSNPGNGESQLNSPQGIAYDPENNLLFVADSGNNRVVIFDTSSIKNGMPAFDFFEFNNPAGLNYNSSKRELAVLDTGNNQEIFDISVTESGQKAVNITKKIEKLNFFWWVALIVAILCMGAVVIFWISFQKLHNNGKIK